jgi:hypothetical protein
MMTGSEGMLRLDIHHGVEAVDQALGEDRDEIPAKIGKYEDEDNGRGCASQSTYINMTQLAVTSDSSGCETTLVVEDQTEPHHDNMKSGSEISSCSLPSTSVYNQHLLTEIVLDEVARQLVGDENHLSQRVQREKVHEVETCHGQGDQEKGDTIEICLCQGDQREDDDQVDICHSRGDQKKDDDEVKCQDYDRLKEVDEVKDDSALFEDCEQTLLTKIKFYPMTKSVSTSDTECSLPSDNSTTQGAVNYSNICKVNDSNQTPTVGSRQPALPAGFVPESNYHTVVCSCTSVVPSLTSDSNVPLLPTLSLPLSTIQGPTSDSTLSCPSVQAIPSVLRSSVPDTASCSNAAPLPIVAVSNVQPVPGQTVPSLASNALVPQISSTVPSPRSVLAEIQCCSVITMSTATDIKLTSSADTATKITSSATDPVASTCSGINAQLLTLPRSIVDCRNLSRPLTLRFRGRQVIVPPSCITLTADGAKLLLPPHTLSPVEPDVSLLPVDYSLHGYQLPKTQASCLDDSKERTTAKVTVDCLVHSFSFLDVADVLRCARVCRQWKEAAHHQTLWKTVQLSSLHVTNWQVAAEFLTARNTQHLMVQDHSNDDIELLATVADQLVTVRHLVVGHCSYRILCGIVENMCQLTALSVSSVDVDDKTSLADKCSTIQEAKSFELSFGKLKDLKSLDVGLMSQEPFYSLQALGQLQHLRHLTLKWLQLTVVSNKEFCFLEQLTQLEELDINSCYQWDTQTFTALGKLVNLRSLRLECESYPSRSCDMFPSVLTNLTRLEHLTLYRISFKDFAVFHQLRQLKNLTVFTGYNPDDVSYVEMNTCVWRAVQHMRFLRQFKWHFVNACSGLVHFVANTFVIQNHGCLNTDYELCNVTELTARLCDALPDTRVTVRQCSCCSQQQQR